MTAGSRPEYLDGVALHLADVSRAVALREFHRVLAHPMPQNRNCPAAIFHLQLALPRHGVTDRHGTSTSGCALCMGSLTKPRECSLSSFPRKREIKASPAF